MTDRKMLLKGRRDNKSHHKPRFIRSASFALLLEGAIAVAATGGLAACTGDNTVPFGTAGNGGASAGGAAGAAGHAGGVGGTTTGGAGGAGGHAGGAGGTTTGGAGGAGGSEPVCTGVNNAETSYAMQQGVPLSFGYLFTYVGQVQNTEDIRMNIDCIMPPFNIETEHVIPLSAEEVINASPNKLIKITNNGSTPALANVHLKIEDPF